MPRTARAQALAHDRDAVVGNILGELDARRVEAQGWQDVTATLAAAAAADGRTLRQAGEADGPWHRVGTALRQALERLVSLGHDLEIVVREQVAITRSGIDLAQLFPPFENDIGLGNRVRLEQDGTATLAHASGPPCRVVAPGEVALTVPIKLTRFGNSVRAQLTATLALNVPPSRDRFERVLARTAHFCPPDAFQPGEALLIIERLQPYLGAISGIVPLPSLPSLPIGRPSFYAGRFNDLISLPATLSKRARRAITPLTSLPAWADSAISLVIDSLLQLVDNEVSAAGASRQGSPRISSSTSFDITVVHREDHTRRIGCVDYGIVATATLVLRCQLEIDPGPTLVLKIRDIDRNLHVDVRPDVLTDLVEQFTNVLADFIAGFLRLVSVDQSFALLGVRRAEVEVTADRLALYLITRELMA